MVIYMKVMHLISGGDVGGAKTHVHTLLKELSKEIPALLVCFKGGPFAEEAKELGISVLVIEEGFRGTLAKLSDIIRSDGYELLHCHGSKANMFGAILKKKLGVPVITTVHSDWKLDYMGRLAKRLTFGTINSVALRVIDDYVCVSGKMRETLIERGFPPQNTFLIANGLDYSDNAVSVEREEFLRKYGIPESAVTVGIAARLSPVKDIGTLIDAFSEAAKTEENLWLLIAGDGEEAESLKDRASRSEAGERIVFAGWLSDTNSFYNAIDINALTSLSEGFPYSIVEGARMRCATVSSAVGGIPALIKNGVTGRLFTPGDGDTLAQILRELASDGSLRKKLGDSIYEAAKEDFSLDSMRRTQIGIYETVLRRSRRGASRRDGVTLCGAYGQGNSGDDSIMESVVSMLRSVDPDMPIRILSRNPEETRKMALTESVHSFSLFGFLRAMKRSKLYISGGGTLIQDVTSLRSLLYYLFNIRCAKAMGCKVLMFGCGVGPVKTKTGRRLTAKTLNKSVDIITLREPHSKTELDDMGVHGPEIRISADPALILAPAPEAEVSSALMTAGVPEGDYAVFALRPWEGFDEKAGEFARAAEYCHKKYGLLPLFITIDRAKDPEACKKVQSLMAGTPSHILPSMSPAITIGLLRRAKLLVSMRLHALVFGAGQGVPLVGAVYDPKVSAFMDYLGSDLHRELSDISTEFLMSAVDGIMAGTVKAPDAEWIAALEEINIEAAKELLAAE